MKRFGSLFLAAVLGSICTIASFQWLDKNEPEVKLKYASGAPASNVSYTVDENGQTIPLDFTAAAEKVMPAVVFIRSTQTESRGEEEAESMDPFRDFFGPRGQRGPSQSSGSGVIINESGYIVTNNHVVKGADIVEVTLYDNRTFKAEVIGADPDTDLAVVKIKADGLHHLSFVDSDKAKVGEWVLAVGNPYNLNSTVTAGIISAKGRNINILGRNSEVSTAIESFIQTDAAINPGNSGGALVELNGGLLGINTAIQSNTGSYSGYGFAVPSNIVSKIVDDLIKLGVVQRGWLGVTVTSLNSQKVKENDLEVSEGAYISGFAEKSSAKEAGLKEGDVVIRIDETPIKSSTTLIEYIGRHRPGDRVNMVVNRKGEELSIAVVLKSRDGLTTTIKKPEEPDAMALLDIELAEVDGKVLKNLDIDRGVKIKDLGNGKVAKYTEMREGFIVTKINDIPVGSVKQFKELIGKKRHGDLIILSGTYEDFPREFNYALRM